MSDAPVPRPAAAPAHPGTFYQVTPQLGELFSRRSQAGAGGGFSLLKMMGRDAHEGKDPGLSLPLSGSVGKLHLARLAE